MKRLHDSVSEGTNLETSPFSHGKVWHAHALDRQLYAPGASTKNIVYPSVLARIYHSESKIPSDVEQNRATVR